jgi:hypothetical protein
MVLPNSTRRMVLRLLFTANREAQMAQDAIKTQTMDVPTTAMEFAGRYGTEAVRTLSECQGEYAAFINKRLSEDFAMPQRLAGCKTPMEMMDVWADFYSTAMGHYFDHARQVTEAGTEAAEEFVREAEAEAEELFDATGKALKSVNNTVNATNGSGSRAA